MLSWDEVSDEFVWEGSWRDICVQGTSLADWRAVWGTIRTAGLALTYTVDGVENVPPADVGDIFADPREYTYLAAVVLAGAQLNCHFFSESEIEFDLDPREITSQTQFDALLSFMSALAKATGKVVLMTPENEHDTPFLRLAPSSVPEYISTRGFFRDLASLRP